MTSHFRHHVDLDAPVGRVLDILLDPALHAARYEAAGATGAEVVTLDVEPDGAVTLVSRRAESGSLPGPVARLVRGAAQLTQTERWAAPEPDGARVGVWTVVTKGVPVDIAGSVEVRPHGSGSRLVQTGTVTARAALVSRLIEKVAADQSAVKLDREWAWLAGRLAGSVE